MTSLYLVVFSRTYINGISPNRAKNPEPRECCDNPIKTEEITINKSELFLN